MNQLQLLIQQQQLSNLSTLLQQSLQGINTQSNYLTFQTLQSKPQSYLYFLALLISPHFNENIRQLSGINLKNMLKRNIQSLPEQTLVLIKIVLFQQYDVQEGRLLKTIGLIMGAIVEKIRFEKETLQFLLNKARLGNIFAIEGLKRIVQDFRFDTQNMNLLQSQQFAQLSKQLIAILIPQCYTQNKKCAIECFNVMIYPMPISLVASLKEFVEILKSEIIVSQNNDMLLAVMEGFEAIVSTRKDLIDSEIIEIIANKGFTDTKLLKIEINFWIQVLDSENDDLIRPVLTKLLPKFISGLILTNQDISNIMQTHAKCYVEQNQQQQTFDAQDNEQQIAKGGDYTLRKRCGMMIGKLTFSFSDELWGMSQQYVVECMGTNEWLKHELAILFIGMISENCGESMKENIAEILTMISNCLNNAGNQALLKSTCLWTMSQNISSLVELAVHQEGSLNGYMNILLKYIKDEHMTVKESACDSLSKLIQQIKENVIPWFDAIIEVLTPALQTSKSNLQGLLLQLFCSIAQNIKKQNYNKAVLDKLLVPLCQKWITIPKDSDDHCQFLECMVSVCEMGDEHLGQYHIELFSKALEQYDVKNKHIFCRAADLLETLIKKATIEQQQIISKSGLFEKTMKLLQCNDLQIKQASYSVLSIIFEYIGTAHPAQTMQYVFNSINIKKESEINNGLHCMMDLIVRYPDVKEYVKEVVMSATSRLIVEKLETHYKINYSKLIGTIACYHPQIVAQYIKDIFGVCCKALKASNQHNARYHMAIAGLINLVILKGQQILKDFKYFVDLCVCMKNPPVENQTNFKQILTEYRNGVGQSGWNQFLGEGIFLPGAINKIETLMQS